MPVRGIIKYRWPWGSGEDNLCDAYWELSLQSNVVWPKECRFHLSKDDDRMFKPQLGKNIEIYVDYMVVKSKMVSRHLGDLGGIFYVLRRHKLRLNASKCFFSVGSGKFLCYMVTHRGIEVNLD